MPQVEYTTRIQLSPEQIWEFVKDMNNWAPFLTGYQKHEILNAKDSIWTLRGDVGMLSREVKLQAHITEWLGPEKVSFTLKGLNEMVDGGGTLLMYAADDAAAAGPGRDHSDTKKAENSGNAGVLRRLVNWLFRFLFQLQHGKTQRRQLKGKLAGPGSQLKFTLRMDAGGPQGPLVNAMLAPALLPAAEDLANKIAAHLEKLHGGN